MMKLKIAFTREYKPDLVSKLIQKYLKTDYSHTFFVLNDTSFHSTGKGVHEVPLSDYLQTHVLVMEFEVESNQTESEFLSFMAGSMGKDYGESQYIGFLFPFLQKYLDNNNSKTICSEIVATYLADYCGYKLPKDADFMSPRDVYELLEAKK